MHAVSLFDRHHTLMFDAVMRQIFRRYKAREMLASALSLTSFARRCLARTRFRLLQKKHEAAVAMQSAVRCRFARQYVQRRTEAADKIQSFLRDRFARQMIAASALSFRDYNNDHAAAAVKFEAVARQFLTRRWVSQLTKRLRSTDGLSEAKISLQVCDMVAPVGPQNCVLCFNPWLAASPRQC